MQMGMVGLGRMGANMTRRLMRGGLSLQPARRRRYFPARRRRYGLGAKHANGNGGSRAHGREYDAAPDARRTLATAGEAPALLSGETPALRFRSEACKWEWWVSGAWARI